MELMLNTRELLQILMNIPGIGAERSKKIIRLYREGQDLLFLIHHLYPFLSISDIILRDAVFSAKRSFEKAESLSIQIISYKDQNYPRPLLSIDDFPPLIYVKGDSGILNKTSGAALVGSRRAAEPILEMTGLIGEQLVLNGFTIVSGLALGCDTRAHKTSLKFNSHTIAVMPCGSDIVYPRENCFLYRQIAELRGLIVSEYEPGVFPAPFRFVQRDRIQSGISKIVVLMESSLQGGAMYAAYAALKYKRPLFVYVPPFFNNDNRGNQYLLENRTVFPFSDPSEFALYMNHLDKIVSDCNRESDQLIFPYV